MVRLRLRHAIAFSAVALILAASSQGAMAAPPAPTAAWPPGCPFPIGTEAVDACIATAEAIATSGPSLVSSALGQGAWAISLARAAVAPEQDAIDGATVAADSPLAKAGNAGERPYTIAANCANVAQDAVGQVLSTDREANSGCGGSSDTTYYVGSPGSYGPVPYYGVSNGHELELTDNSIRAGKDGLCIDVYDLKKSGREVGFNGLCEVGQGTLVTDGPTDYVGSAWCDAHTSRDQHQDGFGRCRYSYAG